MYRVFKGWLDRYLSDPEAILLIVFLVGGFFILKIFGDILTPIFVSIAIAILLQMWVHILEKRNCPQTYAFWIVYTAFLLIFFGALLFLLPLLWRQCVNLVTEMPTLVQNGRTAISDFIQSKQDYISEQYVETIFSSVIAQTQDWGKRAITVSLASIPGIITWVVYLILVPLLVFFFLRDHAQLMAWFKQFLPEKRGLIRKIWFEMHIQVGNYFRGKLTEIIIVGLFTYVVFLFFDLRYQVLLASLVGLSVVIPFVGVVIATIPVVLVGYFQYGFIGGLTGEFALMLYSYAFVQLVDGSILVPLLFSNAVNLHPIAIIIAILVFGSLWGFWGVFFAIPLATLVKAIINAWPHHGHTEHHHHRHPHTT
ncbi:MAG TPA: AI-2E family transporter [Gammaproteobacteria bacterium]|nr:AI-2E family transporter [Gammaproteobacteria bacterium]